MPPHPLTNFEIQKYLMVFMQEIIYLKKMDGAYIINLDEDESIGTHWIALYVYAKNVTYFDSFGVEHIPKVIRKFIGNKNIMTNIYKIQVYNSTMYGYFCIGFIDFMLKVKSLLEYTNFIFS